ncbi:uncharacterized protein C8Q71DRAFT_201096 [Rhodofomes roseus]|uniref:Uncharacterized protein n=1 Tax=Rhodofomes roseus TaxID=34475 RepID=A0ABQ8KTU0_9APHY|nr:uncharacterized protein C8Q71DRAFT_201096 [Rhodofomes roseus]KAH9842384.1 hypothetical protein C8Q71DRAFT_201096 [Rhodofomes roseus]
MNYAERIAFAKSDMPAQSEQFCLEQSTSRNPCDPTTMLCVIWLGLYDCCYEEVQDDEESEDQNSKESEDQSEDESGDQNEVKFEDRDEEESGDQAEEESRETSTNSENCTTEDQLKDGSGSQVDEGSEETVGDESEDDSDNESEETSDDESVAAPRTEIAPEVPSFAIQLRRPHETKAPDRAEHPDPNTIAEELSPLFAYAHNMYAKANARSFIFVDVPPGDRAPSIVEQGDSDFARQFIRCWNDRLLVAAREFTNGHSDASLFVLSSHEILSELLDNPNKFGFDKKDAAEANKRIWMSEADFSISDEVHRLLGERMGHALSLVDE